MLHFVLVDVASSACSASSARLCMEIRWNALLLLGATYEGRAAAAPVKDVGAGIERDDSKRTAKGE